MIVEAPPEAPAPPRARYDLPLILAGLVLADGLLLAPLGPEARLAGALVLFVLLPGVLLVQAVFPGSRPGPLERWLLALAAGYALGTFLGLALYVAFRPLTAGAVLGGANVLVGGLLLAALRRRRGRGEPLWPRFGRLDRALLVILAASAPIRLWNLGYSEFQGDEALVLLRTQAVLQGIGDAMIAHRKPPGEILLYAPFAAGLGVVTEFTARLPFALAGLAGVVAVYRLGQRMFGPRAGLAAALLLALNGYFVAFGRILQYQSVGLLLDALGVLCLYQFARPGQLRRGYAVLGAFLLAGSALTALSAVFLLPVAAVALWPRIVGRRRLARRELAVWLWPLALLVPGALLLYLIPASQPGMLDLASAWPYLGPRLGGSRPYFNLERMLLSINHYTSSPYLLVTFGVGGIVVLEALFDRARELGQQFGSRRAGPALAPLLGGLDARNTTAAALVAGSVALLVGTRRRSLAWKLALVWAAGPLFAHLFLVRIPGTHFREIFPGLLLLVGSAAAWLYGRAPSHALRRAAVALGAVFLAASAHYVYVAWIRPWPEYQLQYPAFRHPLDWTRLDVRSAGGTFGAARHHGWKTVAALVAQGALPARYTTNERPAEAAWYMHGSWICDEQAELYILTPRLPQQRAAIEQGETLPGWVLAGRVYVDGRPTLSLLTRQPLPGGPRTYRDEEYTAQFDRDRSSPWTPVGRLYRPGLNSGPECPG